MRERPERVRLPRAGDAVPQQEAPALPGLEPVEEPGERGAGLGRVVVADLLPRLDLERVQAAAVLQGRAAGGPHEQRHLGLAGGDLLALGERVEERVLHVGGVLGVARGDREPDVARVDGHRGERLLVGHHELLLLGQGVEDAAHDLGALGQEPVERGRLELAERGVAHRVGELGVVRACGLVEPPAVEEVGGPDLETGGEAAGERRDAVVSGGAVLVHVHRSLSRRHPAALVEIDGQRAGGGRSSC